MSAIDWAPQYNADGTERFVSTWLRGTLMEDDRGWPWSFAETVARLKTLSGQDPTADGDGYKTSIEFRGTYHGEPFALYDYKGDMELHIGGTAALDVSRLQRALRKALATVVPTPYRAALQYDELTGQTHGWPQ